MKESDVTILLPAFNERESIGEVIKSIKKYGYSNILVVDNLSEDDTYSQAKSNGASMAFEVKRGKGNAIKKGLSLINTPYIVMMDSDYTYPAKYINDIVELLEDYDVVMAERHVRLDNSMSLTNLFGNRIISLLGSILFWYWTPDICTGMWGFKKGVLDKFNIQSTHFTLEADLFVNARVNKCRIARIPISYRARIGGSKSKLHVRNGIGIVWYLIKRRFTKTNRRVLC
jgi:dolichol-phosphate mannosyltransferase